MTRKAHQAGMVGVGALALALVAMGLHAQTVDHPLAAPPVAAPSTPAIPPMLAKPVAKPPAKPVVKVADKPVWNQLSPAQRTALEPLHGEWDPMEGVRKQKWLELANRFNTMKPEEQQRVHERMREWVRLTPDQRKVARQNYTQAKTISPDEKSANWESYKQLPDEQKQKLAEQATRKQLTNLPPTKTVQRTPVLHGAAACPAGSIKNSASATPACVASATAATVAAPAAPAPGTAAAIVTSSAPVK